MAGWAAEPARRLRRCRPGPPGRGGVSANVRELRRRPRRIAGCGGRGRERPFPVVGLRPRPDDHMTFDSGPRLVGIRAVIFDMDGVLVDSEPLWREMEREVAGRLGIELADADLDASTGVRVGDVVRGWHDRWPWDRPPVEDVAREMLDGVGAAVRDRGAALPGAVTAVRSVAGLGPATAL